MSPERTGLVRAPGSAGVPLKSLRAGKRADIVPPSPRAAAEKRLFFFRGLIPSPRTELRELGVRQNGKEKRGPASVEP